MKRGANIRVRLDTRQASADLKKIGKESEAASARVGQRAGAAAGGGGGFGVGAAVGFGAAALGGAARRGSSFLGLGDIASDYTSGVRAAADAKVGGPDRRASNAARERTADVYGPLVGRNLATDAEVKDFYNNVRQYHTQPDEVGRNKVQQMVGNGGEMLEEVKRLGGEAKTSLDEFLDWAKRKVGF